MLELPCSTQSKCGWGIFFADVIVQACSRTLPCDRCINAHIESTCSYPTRKKKRSKKEAQQQGDFANAWSNSSPITSNSSSSSDEPNSSPEIQALHVLAKSEDIFPFPDFNDHSNRAIITAPTSHSPLVNSMAASTMPSLLTFAYLNTPGTFVCFFCVSSARLTQGV